MKDSFASLASQHFWIREIAHIEMYGFVLPITCLKEYDIISMLVSLEEITSIAMVNCHTLTKRWRSQGNVFAHYWTFKKASLSRSRHILLPCSLIVIVWCGLYSLVASFIYYRNQKMSPYAADSGTEEKCKYDRSIDLKHNERRWRRKTHSTHLYTHRRTQSIISDGWIEGSAES